MAVPEKGTAISAGERLLSAFLSPPPILTPFFMAARLPVNIAI